MNEQAREALLTAAMNGTPQIKGNLRDLKGGFCAMGVLCDTFGLDNLAVDAGLNQMVDGCPECGATTQTWHAGNLIATETSLVIHFNNDHGFDFLTIARKMP